jgi:hypothetical protein
MPRQISGWRYRLGVRTEDSQSSNPGSIPGSATIPFRSRIDTAELSRTLKGPGVQAGGGLHWRSGKLVNGKDFIAVGRVGTPGTVLRGRMHDFSMD